MRRHTYCYSIQTSGCSIRHHFTLFHNHRQWSRPEFCCQFLCCFRNLSRYQRQCVHICDMHNQRIIRWSSFCRINFSCCFRIQRICTQTVYGFCWKCNQCTFLQKCARFFHNHFIDAVFIYFSNNCLHYSPILLFIIFHSIAPFHIFSNIFI